MMKFKKKLIILLIFKNILLNGTDTTKSLKPLSIFGYSKEKVGIAFLWFPLSIYMSLTILLKYLEKKRFKLFNEKEHKIFFNSLIAYVSLLIIYRFL